MENKPKLFKVTLETVGKVYKSENEDLGSAIAGLNMTWDKIKNKGVIKVKRGSKSVEHLFLILQLRRIFANKTVLKLWAKRLELLMT